MKNKTFGNTRDNQAKDNVPDLQVYGKSDLWKCISKAWSDGEAWMKSTKAMNVGAGVLIQVTTQQQNPDGSYAVAEALTFIPGVEVCFNPGEDIYEIRKQLR